MCVSGLQLLVVCLVAINVPFVGDAITGAIPLALNPVKAMNGTAVVGEDPRLDD
jgi:hypothetical protein